MYLNIISKTILSICLLVLGYVFRAASSPASPGSVSAAQHRITGESESVLDGLFTYQVSVQLSAECAGRGHVCGAALVGARHALTAAGCVTDKPGDSTWSAVRAGLLRAHVGAPALDNTTAGAGVVRVAVHPDYNPDTRAHDLALLELAEDMSAFGASVELATVAPAGGARCNITGWGITASDDASYSPRLRWAEVSVLENALCPDTVFNATGAGGAVLCAGGAAADLCTGDTGSPLVCGGVLSGVATWSGCGAGSVFTDLTAPEHRAWLTGAMSAAAAPASTAAAAASLALAALLALNYAFVLHPF